jgi:hypothetical protein
MKDTIGKRSYKCKCGSLEEEYVWQSELNKYKFKCTKCKKTIGIESLKVNKVPQTASIRTPTKNR